MFFWKTVVQLWSSPDRTELYEHPDFPRFWTMASTQTKTLPSAASMSVVLVFCCVHLCMNCPNMIPQKLPPRNNSLLQRHVPVNTTHPKTCLSENCKTVPRIRPGPAASSINAVSRPQSTRSISLISSSASTFRNVARSLSSLSSTSSQCFSWASASWGDETHLRPPSTEWFEEEDVWSTTGRPL